MALPFPHGTAAGQIANGAFFDNADTPGSTGGRFVGFGEYGTSAIANRSAWALSTNINFLMGILNGSNPVEGNLDLDGLGIDNCTEVLFEASASQLAWALAEFVYTPSPGSPSATLAFTVNDTVTTLQIILDSITASLSPTSGAIDLGIQASPWNDLWATVLHLMGDQMYVDYSGTNGAFKVPLLAPADYMLQKEDFALGVQRSVGDAVGTWLALAGDAGGTLYSTAVKTGRSTTSRMETASGAATVAALNGPAMLKPNVDLLTASAAFLIADLSGTDAGETFKVFFGFNLTAGASDPCAYIVVDDFNEIWLVANDGSGFAYQDVGPASNNTWYDCTISFTSTHVVFTINGISWTIALVSGSSTQWAFTALKIARTGGVSYSIAYIDYAEMHTEGHTPRPTT